MNFFCIKNTYNDVIGYGNKDKKVTEEYLEQQIELHTKNYEIIELTETKIGVLNPVNNPEDMPETIVVKTKDFIQLMVFGGMLCDLKPPESAKKKFNKEIREIALRHHINFVGEIK